MISRFIEHRLKKGEKSILLLGPRQVGKSTLVKRLSPDYVLNLSDEEIYLNHLKDPGLLKKELLALKRPKLVSIDEVQRLPFLLNTVQYLIDEGFGARFILTGSSARKLRQGGANLLPGRVIEEHLGPLTYWELGKHFDLQKSLTRGMLPGIYFDDNTGVEILKTYTQVYLKEEIRSESFIRNVAAYARFLELAAGQSGLWINYSKIASDSEVTKDTLRRFYEVLEDTLLAIRIPPYTPSLGHRRISQRDRIFIFDLGVRHALLGLLNKDFTPTETGHLFEHWLILQVYYYAQVHKKDWRFFSFRTDIGDEVDLVIQTPKKLFLIEVKSGKKVDQKQLKGLNAFEYLTQKKGEKIVIFNGEKTQKIEDILIYPYRYFLNEILPGF